MHLNCAAPVDTAFTLRFGVNFIFKSNYTAKHAAQRKHVLVLHSRTILAANAYLDVQCFASHAFQNVFFFFLIFCITSTKQQLFLSSPGHFSKYFPIYLNLS